MGEERHIGVAISGGGHRATAFGFGALLALVDADANSHVLSISSVSGGSITNGVTAAGPDYGTVTAEAYEAHIRPTLNVVANVGLLLGFARATKWYVIRLAALVVVGAISLLSSLVVAWFGAKSLSVALLVVGVLALVGAWLTFRRRAAITRKALDAEMFNGRSPTLGELQRKGSSVHHVICTTELQSGEAMYFTNRCVWNYRFGGSTEENIVPLSSVVQASASVPGAFDPLNIALATLHLDPLTVQVTKKNAVADHTIDRVILNDGGVYDNMADQWEYGYPNRADEWSGPNGLASIQQHRASYLIVVNGSQGWNTPRPIGKGGFTQEKEGLMRAQGVQYDVSTSHRRQALYTLFRAAEARPTGAVDGIFAQINDSPYRIPINFGSIALAKARAENKPGLWDDDMAARADEAVAFLDTQPDYQPEFWSALAAANASTKTTLAKLGPARAATLLEHGYVLTMVLMYVLDNRGTLRPIDRTRFQRLCS